MNDLNIDIRKARHRMISRSKSNDLNVFLNYVEKSMVFLYDCALNGPSMYRAVLFTVKFELEFGRIVYGGGIL